MKIANIAGAMGGSSRTYLTHLFGRGLDDEKYRVERFRSMAEGMIRPWHGVRGPGKARNKTGDLKLCPVVSLGTVQAMRPEPNEIIVCTGIKTGSGCQLWGALATNLFIQAYFC